MADTSPPDGRDDLHYVGGIEQFDENGDRLLVDIDGREIAVIYSNGDLHALLNYCVHQGGPVCEGPLGGALGQSLDGEFSWEHDDELVICPWHGWEFHVDTGRHVTRSEFAIPTYETVVSDGSVYVAL